MWTCAYRNESNRMVILRCLGAPTFFHEKVIFPFEIWTFDCPPDSEVEIWTHGLGAAELEARFAAAELRVDCELELLHQPVALGFAGLVVGGGQALTPVAAEALRQPTMGRS